MHRQFVRLLFAIALILIAISILQVACITVFSQRLIYTWSSQVFDEFAQSVSSSLSKATFTDASSIYDYVFSNVSERISGFVLRSVNGGQMLTFGQSGNGQIIPQLASFVNNSFTYMDDGSTSSSLSRTNIYELPSAKYKLSIVMKNPLSTTIDSVDFSKTDSTEPVYVAYPSSVKKGDIAGTIAVYINDSLSAYLDVLVYSVDYYTPTKFILHEVYKVLGITIPLVLIVGFILAYFVSKRTERNVKNIEKALSSLSEGHFDITVPDSKIMEYNQIGSSIEELGRDLERHSASRKEWIRNISHDLNTPVTSMNMVLEGVLDGLFPLSVDTIKTLKKENDSLRERIASVSYYSYLLSPDAECKKSEVVLKDEVETAMSLTKGTVNLSFPPTAIVYADSNLLTRALEEVIKNAIEYKKGDGKPTIFFLDGGEYTTIKVANPGSLPHPLPQFFEPWSRGDSSRTSGGSGLGLSIVYQIMQLHNGSVDITENGGEVIVSLKFPTLDYFSVV